MELPCLASRYMSTRHFDTLESLVIVGDLETVGEVLVVMAFKANLLQITVCITRRGLCGYARLAAILNSIAAQKNLQVLAIYGLLRSFHGRWNKR
jgi:hypothetical protein